MGKRKSAAAAINAATDANMENEELRVKALATIPRPTFRDDIPLDACYVDRTLNVRDETSYGKEANKALYESLRDQGQLPHGDTPVWMEDGSGGFLTLVGNLRTSIMQLIRAEAKEQQRNNPDMDIRIPFITVFGLVYPTLTRDQQIALVADHGIRRGLSPYEQCLMIGRVMEAGYVSQAKMAVHFGMDRIRVQRLWYRYQIPLVREEFRKEHHAPDQPHKVIGNEQLGTLYTAFHADRIAGDDRPIGANLKKTWEAMCADPNFGKPSQAKKEKQTQSKDDIVNQVKGIPLTFGDGPEVSAVQTVLRWAGNAADDEGRPANLNAALDDLTTYCKSLRAENDKLRAEVETLRTDAKQFAEEIGRLAKDLESERENVRIMEEQFETLRADLKSARESAEVK